MFRWYRDAAICYIYLADVEITAGPDPQDLESRIAMSRWFTRGWTLQELLAPRQACFYSADWSRLGTKAELADIITSVTRIEPRYLSGEEDIHRASVSRRMSWASSRETSRVEDIAYCLLGIFDINLPLIYGEGDKAFQRLQGAIMQSYPEDHTLFAWGTIVATPSTELLGDELYEKSTQPLLWKAPEDRPASAQLFSMLAQSPRDFKDSHSIVPSRWAKPFYRHPDIRALVPMRLGSSAVRLELPFPRGYRDVKYYWDNPNFAQVREARFPILLCKLEGAKGDYMIITIIECDDYLYGRTRELVIPEVLVSKNLLSRWKREVSIGPPVNQLRPESKDIVFRRFKWTQDFSGVSAPDNCCFFNNIGNGIVSDSGKVQGKMFALEFRQSNPEKKAENEAMDKPKGFAMLFSRGVHGGDDAPITVGMIPFSSVEGFNTANPPADPMIWPKMEALLGTRPTSEKTMKSPVDQWSVTPPSPFSDVFVQVERVPFGSEGSYIEAVDLIIT